MPDRLLLVRHARPLVEPDMPPDRWVLSEEGVEAARELLDALPPGSLLVSSPEPKAWQTIDPDDQLHAYRDERFGEVRRDEGFIADWAAAESARAAYVGGTAHAGWESPADVIARFDEGLADAEAHAAGRPLVVATHGMVLTVWLTAKVGLTDPVAFWRDLRLPDVLAVDLIDGTVTRVGLSV